MLPKFLRTSIFFVSFFAFVCLFALFVDFVDFVPGRASSARLSDHLRLCQSLGSFLRLHSSVGTCWTRLIIWLSP